MSRAVICLLSVLLAAHARRLYAGDGDQKGFPMTLPPNCTGQELCLTKPIDYPSDYIDRIARRLQTRSKRHYEDEGYTNFTETTGCTASRQVIQPFVAVYNQTRHLVIQSEFYKQAFPSVICRNEGAACLLGFKFSKPKPTCITKFTSVNLSVLDSKEAFVTNISVTFPVECACAVEDEDSE